MLNFKFQLEKIFLFFLVFFILLFFATNAIAENNDKFPKKEISLVVPYSAGSANDLIARLVAPGLAENLGVNIIVLNKPGAGGAVGTGYIARSNPDGYTIGLGGSATLGVNPNLYSNLTYDTTKDFTSLIRLATAPNVLVVSGNSDIESLDQLVNKMKNQRLRYNSFGRGTTQHLASALLANQLHVIADHVPYKNAGEAVAALMSNQIDFGFYALPAVLGHIRSGKLKALGTTIKSQLPDLSYLPVIDGPHNLNRFEDTSVWFGLIGPAHIPDHISNKLYSSIRSVLNSTDLQNKLIQSGYIPSLTESKEQFSKFIIDQLAFWKNIVNISEISKE